MIHVYPTSGGHIAFKRLKPFKEVSEVVMAEKDTIWISPAFVCWLQDTAQFIMLPWAKIDNIHIIRKIGDEWDFASGG
jgi:hypothetical protein